MTGLKDLKKLESIAGLKKKLLSARKVGAEVILQLNASQVILEFGVFRI